MRQGKSEIGVTELLALSEYIFATGRTMGALLLDAGGSGGLIEPLPDDPGDERVRAIFHEISAEEERLLGVGQVPVFWRTLAINPHYLAATWRKHQVVLGPGELTEEEKLAVALGVSMASTSRPLIKRFAAILSRRGWSPGDLLEIAGVADHYHSFNKITDAMQVESDIVAPGYTKSDTDKPR